MGRFSLAVVALSGALLTAGCGDPIVVLGDTPGLMRIVLGIGDSIGTRVDTVATRMRLTEPQGVAFAPETGVLYVADRGASRSINGITTRVARIMSVTSNGRARVQLDAGGCTVGPCIVNPVGMVFAGGALIIADPVGHRVMRYVPGGATSVVAGTGTAAASADGAVAAQSPVNRPNGVAVLDDGRILFSEAGSNRVRVIGTDGRLSTFAGSGSATSSGDGGPATSAGIFEPAGLAVADGIVYIAETGSSRIRAVEAGTISTVAGVGVAGYSGDDGPAAEARLSRPVALAVSANGRTLFVSDQDNHRVRAVDLVTGTIRTFAGTGSSAWSGSRLAAGQTALSGPASITTGLGFLFIADRGHSVVWRTNTDLN